MSGLNVLIKRRKCHGKAGLMGANISLAHLPVLTTGKVCPAALKVSSGCQRKGMAMHECRRANAMPPKCDHCIAHVVFQPTIKGRKILSYVQDSQVAHSPPVGGTSYAGRDSPTPT